MCRGKGIVVINLIKEECNSHDDCKECDFYSGETKASMCIFDAPLTIRALDISNLPNLEKEYNAVSMMEVALDSERKL